MAHYVSENHPQVVHHAILGRPDPSESMGFTDRARRHGVFEESSLRVKLLF